MTPATSVVCAGNPRVSSRCIRVHGVDWPSTTQAAGIDAPCIPDGLERHSRRGPSPVLATCKRIRPAPHPSAPLIASRTFDEPDESPRADLRSRCGVHGDPVRRSAIVNRGAGCPVFHCKRRRPRPDTHRDPGNGDCPSRRRRCRATVPKRMHPRESGQLRAAHQRVRHTRRRSPTYHRKRSDRLLAAAGRGSRYPPQTQYAASSPGTPGI